MRILTSCRGARLWVAVAMLWAIPTVGQAAPITYFGNGGTVTISVTTGTTTLAVVPGVPLDNSSFITFDAVVPEEVTDIELVVLNVGPVGLSQPYLGYNAVTVHDANLTPALNYVGTGVVLDLPGPPVANYSYSIGPLKLFGTFSATGNFPVPPIVTNTFQSIFPLAVGKIFVNTITGNIAVLGVTIGVIPSSNLVLEPFPLVIKGDFFFHGIVPEPTTALLLGAGLVGLLAAGRRLSA